MVPLCFKCWTTEKSPLRSFDGSDHCPDFAQWHVNTRNELSSALPPCFTDYSVSMSTIFSSRSPVKYTLSFLLFLNSPSTAVIKQYCCDQFQHLSEGINVTDVWSAHFQLSIDTYCHQRAGAPCFWWRSCDPPSEGVLGEMSFRCPVCQRT